MKLMPYNDALARLLDDVSCTHQIETVPLKHATGRILAQNLMASMDAPRFDNSAMDGYAVCGLDIKQWRLIDSVAAGDSTQNIILKHGEAVRVLTGAAIPQGTDAVVAQEDVQRDDALHLQTHKPIPVGQHIRRQGEEYRTGEALLHSGMVLNAAAIGVIASQGLSHIRCFQRLRVTVFSSGNELQVAGSVLKENQIYDSNRLMLLAALNEACYEAIDGGLLTDDLSSTIDNLHHAAKHSEVVLISGGASVGDKDYTKDALAKLGEIQHWKLAIKPGKPFGWGRVEGAQVFLLPGNPVASWVTFLTLVQPALTLMAGRAREQVLPQTRHATAVFDLPKPQSRQQFLRGSVHEANGQLAAHIYPKQGSAMLASCAHSSALIIIPADTVVRQGELVEVMDLH